LVRTAPALPLALRFCFAAHKALRSASTPGQAASARRFLKNPPAAKDMLTSGLGHKPTSAFSCITLAEHTCVRMQTVAPAVAGFLPAGRSIASAVSFSQPAIRFRSQTIKPPHPQALRGLLAPKTYFYKVSKTFAFSLPPKPLQGPAKILF